MQGKEVDSMILPTQHIMIPDMIMQLYRLAESFCLTKESCFALAAGSEGVPLGESTTRDFTTCQ